MMRSKIKSRVVVMEVKTSTTKARDGAIREVVLCDKFVVGRGDFRSVDLKMAGNAGG
jgi:hypothetical protein